ncbi:MAG: ABC transporter substrate-binding protein [Lachnospiraceae bacterium]|nr:ABC transporter substrate-binding protein [Lachnospiraceae bacterium]
MKQEITRRDFLRGTVAGMAGVALTGIVGGSFGMTALAEEEQADSIVIGCASDPESFSPWLSSNRGRQNICANNLYEPLARLNAEGEREFVLAKSAEPVEEGCYQIELYDYIYDSAGNHITASDVIFSFDKCIEQGALAWAVKYLDHFEQVDDYTLLMYVQDESAVALDMLLKTVYIVSEEAFNASEDEFAVDPVATGPYLLDSYTSGSETVLVARDDYWQTDESLISTGAKLGSVKTVTYKIITDTSQLALALEMGDIEGSNEIVTADLDNFLDEDRNARDGFNSVQILDPRIYFTAFNCSENSPCQDQLVRQAISYAIDTEAIAQNVCGADGSAAATNSSPYYADYDESLNDTVAYAQDLDKAQELLAEAGYADGLSLKGCFSSSEGNSAQVASLMQAYLGQIGIDLEINMYESGLFTTMKTDDNSWDFFVDCTVGLNTPGRMGLLDINGYTTGTNGVFVADEELQTLYETANAASTYNTESVTALLEYVDEMDYVYPMYYSYTYVITTGNVTDIVIDRDNAIIPGACTVLAK